MWAVSDIDGDGTNACVALFKPTLSTVGSPDTTAEAVVDADCPTAVSFPTGAAGDPPFGQPVVVTGDKVF